MCPKCGSSNCSNAGRKRMTRGGVKMNQNKPTITPKPITQPHNHPNATKGTNSTANTGKKSK